MSDDQPMERQWRMLRMLSAESHGWTTADFASEFGVSQKTVRRDLKLLRTVGFAVEEQIERHGLKRWVLRGAQAPGLTFDQTELMALYLAQGLLDPLAGTVLWEAAQSAFRRIRAGLSQPLRDYLQLLDDTNLRTTFRTSNYSAHRQIVDDIQVAVEERRFTHITYQSARSSEPLSYPIHPLAIIWHRGSLYLVADSEQHGPPDSRERRRTFKLDRISHVKFETLRFVRPADFDLATYLTHSFGIIRSEQPPQRVVIRFAPEVRQYVAEHRWHPSQVLTVDDHGRTIAEFQLSTFAELISWVLSFGRKAVVLEPEEVREGVRAALEAAAAQYASTSDVATEQDEEAVSAAILDARPRAASTTRKKATRLRTRRKSS